MTTPQQHVEVLRERLADERHHAGKGYAEVERRIAAYEAAIAALQAQASALAYATRLATAMHRDHYAADAPQWEPCPDLMGVLSQIDNILTGLTRQQASAPGGVEEAFVEAMKGRVYGEEETADARAWFVAGWDASRLAPSAAPRPVPPANAKDGDIWVW